MMNKLIEISGVIVKATHTTAKKKYDIDWPPELIFYGREGYISFHTHTDQEFLKDMVKLRGVIDSLIKSVETSVNKNYD